jgi:hypothetical protein
MPEETLTVEPVDAEPGSDEAAEQYEEQRQVHEEAATRRNAGPYGDFESYEDAYEDYQQKQQKLAEAVQEAQAAEQSLPQIKIALQQKQVDELKEKGVEYDEQGRQLGVNGSPVSNPLMYGGNPAPDTLGTVH